MRCYKPESFHNLIYCDWKWTVLIFTIIEVTVIALSYGRDSSKAVNTMAGLDKTTTLGMLSLRFVNSVPVV